MIGETLVEDIRAEAFRCAASLIRANPELEPEGLLEFLGDVPSSVNGLFAGFDKVDAGPGRLVSAPRQVGRRYDPGEVESIRRDAFTIGYYEGQGGPEGGAADAATKFYKRIIGV